MSKKRSPIWDYFTVTEDTRYVHCNSCNDKISCGGKTTKTFNTTNLVYHLKNKHAEQYSEYQKKLAKQLREETLTSLSNNRQLTLQETRKCDINDVHAQQIHTRIGEMITLDYQSLSIVDDVGFTRLLHTIEPQYVLPSRRYMTEVVLPRIYDSVKESR